jgi:hypothetical protein
MGPLWPLWPLWWPEPRRVVDRYDVKARAFLARRGRKRSRR